MKNITQLKSQKVIKVNNDKNQKDFLENVIDARKKQNTMYTKAKNDKVK